MSKPEKMMKPQPNTVVMLKNYKNPANGKLMAKGKTYQVHRTLAADLVKKKYATEKK